MIGDEPTPLGRPAQARDHPSLGTVARDQLAGPTDRLVTSSGHVPELTPAVARPGRVTPFTRSRHRVSWPTSRSDGVLIIHADGPADTDFADRLDHILGLTAEASIVDLSEASVTHPSALSALDPTRSGRHAEELCAVTRHASHHELLTHQLGDRVAVFTHRADALQARLLHRLGYGPGWQPG